MAGLLVSPLVAAAECVVATPADSGSGSLREAVAKANTGSCAASGTSFQKRYEPHVMLPSSIQVIRIPKSVDIHLATALPSIQSSSTILITADSVATVRIMGQPLSIGSGVIIDHLTIQDVDGIAVQMQGNDSLLIHSTIAASGRSDAAALQITGNRVAVVKSSIANNRGIGVEIDDGISASQCGATAQGQKARIFESSIFGNGGAGVHIHAPLSQLHKNDIHHNRGAAVRVVGEPGAVTCPVNMALLYTSLLSENSVHHNSHGIVVSPKPLAAPLDLVDVSHPSATFYRIVGSIDRSASYNLANAQIELFLADGTFLTRSKMTDPQNHRFVITIAKPLPSTIIVATVSDPEHNATSPYSEPLDIAKSTDWDGDGIPNNIEDDNQDGIVNVETGETDPRLQDTDADGLKDGVERSMGLNPVKSDSDGDCLPDGLEMGIAAFEYPKSTRAASFKISAACISLLKLHKLYKDIFTLTNVLLRDVNAAVTLDNIIGIYDTNPTTHTDPANPDTDGDGLNDGAEDWNWDGAVTADEKGVVLESDPTVADSDGDGLNDGEEDHDEASPIAPDSDHDGVNDAQEVREGSNPSQCDSDGDGLSDGIETNQTAIPGSACPGAPEGGVNFKYPSVLNSRLKDSDGDGLNDGAEDANHNGWLDPMESDPTTPDTDSDGISDDIEATGDADRDTIPDFFLGDVSNGSKCTPPKTMNDLDCDGLSNAQDTDSDNDGCPDRTEGLGIQGSQSVPAAYTSASKSCHSNGGGSSNGGSSNGGGGASGGRNNGGGLSGGGNAAPSISEVNPRTGLGSWNSYWAGRSDGGGDCSLIRQPQTPGTPSKALFFLAALLTAMLGSARNKLRPKS